jgi:hypothetical protein
MSECFVVLIGEVSSMQQIGKANELDTAVGLLQLYFRREWSAGLPSQTQMSVKDG